jgi:MFS transporter, SP family, inositol transporter
MPLIDRVNRRTLLIWSTLLQLAAFMPFIFFDATFLTSLINVVLPTLLRSTAQGFMFGVVRIALGGWLLLVPKIQDWGFSTLSVILFGLLLVSGLVGILFAPDTTGRDLEETQQEPTRHRRFARHEASEPVSAG